MKIFKQIIEGWRNNLFPPEELKEKILMVSEIRMAFCRPCHLNSDNQPAPQGIFVRPDTHCTACGCTLSAKTKAFSASCPFNKWEALTTEEEWAKIKQIIGDGSD